MFKRFLTAAFFFMHLSAFASYGVDNRSTISQSAAVSELTEENSTPLQRSLYWQGFDVKALSEDNSVPLEMLRDNYASLEIPPDIQLKLNAEIRDAKKSFDEACKEKNGIGAANLAKHYILGIGTSSNPIEASKLYNESPWILMSAEKIENPPSSLQDRVAGSYPPMVAYMYYHGIGLSQNIEKSDAILAMKRCEHAWRNFYTGWCVPEDFELAVRSLSRSETFWAAQKLVDIYSGKYLPEHVDEDKAATYAKVAAERRAVYESGFNRNNEEYLKAYQAEQKKNALLAFRILGTKTFFIEKNYAFVADSFIIYSKSSIYFHANTNNMVFNSLQVSVGWVGSNQYVGCF